MWSVEGYAELRRAEEEHKRKLVEIENDGGPRGSAWTSSSDDVRGTKRKSEDDGERDDAKRQDSMVVNYLREEELTKRDIDKTNENKMVKKAVDGPPEDEYAQGLTES